MKNNIIEETKMGSRKSQMVFLALIVSLMTQTSCKKIVEVPPPAGQITADFVFTTDATAISVLTGLYKTFNTNPIQGASTTGSISLFAGLAADEYALNDGVTATSYVGYYTNSLAQFSGPSSGAEHWAPLYNFIFKCNAAIEGLNDSKNLTPVIKQQLLGEAKFIRAFFYFYLVNMFGDVPLALTTDPEINTLLARSPKAEVYDQIKKDLLEAKDLLSDNFLDATLLNITSQRVRPTRWAAAALLARVYLHTSNWSSAEEQATSVINNMTLFNLPANINDVFLKNSREAIWQIQPTDLNFNTVDARVYVIPATGPSVSSQANPVRLSSLLKSSFEPNDQRAVFGNWIDTTIYNITPTMRDTVAYPFKYKIFLPNTTITNTTGTSNMTEYFMVLRLAEQYLIRSEARARLSNIAGAQSDLNTIRSRAGLPNTTAGDMTSLLTAILNERRHELFSEWGHRWFDLKRTGKIDEVMTVVTPIKSNGANTWHSYQQWYPISLSELQRAPNLTQNPGY